MQLVEVVLLGAAIGAVLGGLGGGGAILTVPALVYVVGQGAQEATTASLVIVGLTALVGVLSYASGSQVRWRLALVFGLVGFPATWTGSLLNHRVDPDLLLLGFAALMLVAAIAMVGTSIRTRGRGAGRSPVGEAGTPQGTDGATDGAAGVVTSTGRGGLALAARESGQQTSLTPVTAVVVTALMVGLITGFFGVGGGFVVVPALVIVLKVPMHQAVGTSLLIVAVNSATSLISRVPTASFDWSVIIPFTVAAMVATLIGKRVADRLPAVTLKKGFAGLLILVALYTGWQSAAGLAAAQPDDRGETGPAGGRVGGTSTDPAGAAQAIAKGAGVIDVRTPIEFAAGHLDGALNADVGSTRFMRTLDPLERNNVYVIYCASGARAATAIAQLESEGFTRLVNGGGYDRLADMTETVSGQPKR